MPARNGWSRSTRQILRIGCDGMPSSQADGSVVIDTTIDTAELKKGIDQANKTVDDFVKKTGSGFSTIDKDIDSTSQKAQKLKIEPTTEGIDEAVRQLDNLNARIEVQERQLENYQNEYARLSDQFGSTSDKALAMQKRILSAEAAIEKMTKASDQLAGDIRDAEEAMETGASSAGEYSGKLEDTKEASEKAGEGSKTLQTALGDLISKGIQKALSSLVDLIDKTKEFRGDMSKLEQNARDSGVSLGITDEAMRRLYAVTGETDSSMEALSNLMASGFNDNTMLDAVEALEGAVVRFPDTIKIESLADSLQETLATKEATGAFAEVLGRVGINVEDYNKKIGKMSEAAARNYTVSLLQKAGLADTAKEWENNNKEMVEANKAAYDLQKTQSDLLAVMEPLRAQVLQQLNKLLSDNKEAIVRIIDAAAKLASIVLGLVSVFASLPTPVQIIIASLITLVALFIKTYQAIDKVTSGTGTVKGALANAKRAFSGLNPTMLRTTAIILTVVAALTALAAIIAIIMGKSNELKSGMKSIGDAVGNIGTVKPIGYARGTLSARRGWALVGERGPEAVNFGGGEQVINATQTTAMRAIASPSGGSYQDNRQYIFKVDDIATYAAIERRMQSERQSKRMGYVGAY